PGVIAAHKTGWVFLGATPNGISYYKSDAVIGEKSIFIDAGGNGYTGVIGSIATRDRDTYFFGAGEYLIKWRRSTDETQFIKYNHVESVDPAGPAVYYVAFAPDGNLWV